MAEIQDDGYLERIKDFFAQQAQAKLERDMMLIEAQQAAFEQLKPTPAQAAYLGAQFAPGAGVTDAAGAMASFPTSEAELQDAFAGESMPSLAENLGEGRYFDAGLQSLGIVGDAAYGIPLVGPVAAGVLKAPKIAKTLLTAGRMDKGSRADKIAALRAEANALRFGDEADEGIGSLNVDTSYRISHQPSPRDPEAIQLDNLSKDISGNQGGYPEDFYTSEGQRLYAQGPRFADDEYGIANEQSYNAIIKAKGNPESEVTIYRAVPQGIDTINQGDFVTLSPKYAELHASSGYGSGGDEVGEVISQRVKVKDVLWAGDDVNEFGYFPAPAAEIDQGIGALPRGATTLKVSPDTKLPKEMAEIETRFTQQLNADLDGAIDQYRNLPDSDGGRIINTDLARELSPDYVADRTLSAAVHEPASAFTKAYYAKLLSEPAAPGKFNEVLFTGGGTGAGKSTALEDVLLEKNVKSQIVYDTNLAGFPSSMKKVDEALDAGKDVTIAYVYRDPIEALTGGGEFGGGAVQRAKRMGRTVPVDIHVGTHVRSIETIKDLAKHYEGNPNVDIRVIDNSRGPGEAFDAGNDLSGLPEYDYNELLKEATNELDKARKEGWLPQNLYEGFVPAKAGSKTGS